MKAIILNKYGGKPIFTTIPIPIPKEGELLVKVKYTPIHPADIYYSLGVYGTKLSLPTQMGMEGSGEYNGKPVCFIPTNSIGSWAEYALTRNEDCYTFDEGTDLLQGSMSLINPFTVLGFRDMTNQCNYSSVLFSSARSTTALMGIRLFQHTNKQEVFAISSQPQESINTLINDDTLISQISKHITKPTIFFDSHGGDLAGEILNALPTGSMLVNYGSSSRKMIGKINPTQLIFSNKAIRGFWMHEYYNNISQPMKQQYFKYIQSLPQIFNSPIHKKITMIEELQEQHKSQGMGKLIWQFN